MYRRLENVASVFYTMVTPIINPLIYSLMSSESCSSFFSETTVRLLETWRLLPRRRCLRTELKLVHFGVCKTNLGKEMFMILKFIVHNFILRG